MSELTREYLDQKLDSQTTELKSYVDEKITGLDEKIVGLEKNLDAKIENEVANLAGMMSRRFDELEKKLDVRAEVDQLKSQMNKVWQALNIKS
ncbi:MAG TPA: hypothetical protein VJC06_02865 [Candidatus Paceibacterota bacterium]